MVAPVALEGTPARPWPEAPWQPRRPPPTPSAPACRPEQGRVHCQVIAPALVPRKPGERIKTDRGRCRRCETGGNLSRVLDRSTGMRERIPVRFGAFPGDAARLLAVTDGRTSI